MTIELFKVPQEWYYPKIPISHYSSYKARKQYAAHIGDDRSAKIHTWIERYIQIKDLIINRIVTEVKQANRDKPSIQIKIEKNPIDKLKFFEKQFICECLNVKYGIKVLQIDETNQTPSSFEVSPNFYHTKIQSIEEVLFTKWKNSIDTDFIFFVNGNKFPCHRLALETIAPTFDRLLTKPSFKEALSGIYSIDDTTISPAIFKAFLEFIYTRKISIPPGTVEIDSLIRLLSLSDLFQVEELKDQIITLLKNQINEETVQFILEASQVYNAPILSKSCYDFLTETYSFENQSVINELLQRFGFKALPEIHKDQFLHQMLNQPAEFLKKVQTKMQKEKCLLDFFLPHVQWVKEHQDEYIAILISFFKDKEKLLAFCIAFKEVYRINQIEGVKSDEETKIINAAGEALNCIDIVTLLPFFATGSLEFPKKEYLDPDLQDELLLQYGGDFLAEWQELLQNEAFEHKLRAAFEKDFTTEDQNALSLHLALQLGSASLD